MSAALPLAPTWAPSRIKLALEIVRRREEDETESAEVGPPALEYGALVTFAFYRKHTERVLRHYLYASMLVGRTPSIMDNTMVRGWASSRPVHSFEDAVIFVLDVERCLAKLNALDRQLLSRVVLQEYTLEEMADDYRLSIRAIANRFTAAVDRLTQLLLEAGLLVFPRSSIQK